jgi:hypothetical protein|tara:strand:+ start:68 stop:298 length:231 start_codon:yes stop_codon:yes gene_type:complete
MLSNYEAWLQTAQTNESITYHEGYLAKDRIFSNDIRDIGNLFMRAYESKRVILFQKRMEYGNLNHDPKFQYIAKKI